MIKFDNYKVTFIEIPTEVSLTFSITGCKNECVNCHSSHLRNYYGEDLTINVLEKLIEKNKYISCVTFLGGDDFKEDLIELLKFIKSKNLKTALYIGKSVIAKSIEDHLDYLKFGAYIEELGALDNKNTNQRLIDLNKKEDITYLFWKSE